MDDEEHYELGRPKRAAATAESDYGATWDDDDDDDVHADTRAFVDSERLVGFDDSDADDAAVDQVGVPYESKGLYFRDGRRKIDYVLVYEEPKPKGSKLSKRSSAAMDDSEGEPLTNKPRDPVTLNRHERWRTKFMGNLRKIGLDMEEEVVESVYSTTHFIKLCAPWSVLVHYAEELNLRAPLQAYVTSGALWSDNLCLALRIPNPMKQDVPCKPLHYYTCAFKKSKIDKFLNSDNHDTYFTNTQRTRVVHEILQTSLYGKRRHAEIGVDRLVETGVYAAAFPLHEGGYKAANDRPISKRTRWTRRQILYEFWAKWGRWYKHQPMDHVREYFGEKIAYYFAFLGFYTAWLIPAAVVGIIVFLYGAFAMPTNPIANEVCESETKYKMCPVCDEEHGCTYWYLSDLCYLYRLACVFAHPGTVFYAIFVSLWSVFFLEYWKRHSFSLAHYWDCLDMDAEEERARPQFAARAPHVERNPVTGIREPSFPKKARTKRVAVGLGVILVMIALVVIFIVAVILYRIIVSIPLFRNHRTRAHATEVASLTGAVIQLIIIMILGKIYERVAERITEWEMHRTQQDYEDHLTFKVFIFQFVNFYSAIFYIAFIKGRFTGYPGHYKHLFGLRPEDCSGSGCLVELAQQLAVIMVGKQIINNVVEVIVPKVKSYLRVRRMRRGGHVTLKSRWEEDYRLLPYEGLFWEYLEMVIQYGFITIFVAAFPLAPLFALLNNWVELRLDAQKLICETRRVVAFRAEDIGVLFTILESLTHLAVISNAFLIAFTSDFIPRMVYMYTHDWNLKGYTNFTLAHAPEGTMSEDCRYFDYRDERGHLMNYYWTLLAIRLAFVIIFEHVVFFVLRFIVIAVPDIPESLDLKIRRERYLAKQALADVDNILKIKQQMEREEHHADDDA